MSIPEILQTSEWSLYSGVLLAALGVGATIIARPLHRSHKRLADVLDAAALGTSILSLVFVFLVPVLAGWPPVQIGIVAFALVVAVLGLMVFMILGGIWTRQNGSASGEAGEDGSS